MPGTGKRKLKRWRMLSFLIVVFMIGILIALVLVIKLLSDIGTDIELLRHDINTPPRIPEDA